MTLLIGERGVPMENVAGVRKKSKRKESRYGKRYGLEFKLRCVKSRLEEGLPVSLLPKEAGARLFGVETGCAVKIIESRLRLSLLIIPFGN